MEERRAVATQRCHQSREVIESLNPESVRGRSLNRPRCVGPGHGLLNPGFVECGGKRSARPLWILLHVAVKKKRRPPKAFGVAAALHELWRCHNAPNQTMLP